MKFIIKDLKPNKGASNVRNGIDVADKSTWPSNHNFGTNYGEGMYYGHETADLSKNPSWSTLNLGRFSTSNCVGVNLAYVNHEAFPARNSYFDLVLKATSDEFGGNATDAYFKFTPTGGKEVVIYTKP